MHPATPRGTQCDTLEIIAGVFSPIIATRWREKAQLCPQMVILARTMVTFHVLEKACANVLEEGGGTKKTFIVV